MTRAGKPGRDATLRQALIYMAWHPRIWPGFARVLVRHIAAKVRLYVACWCAGYSVREVRRLAREASR